jgi:photosystem II stability/assembly factor-like uncharacterized protein
VESVAFLSPNPAKVITDSDGANYPVDQLIIVLQADQGADVALAIADSVGGSVAGFSSASNSYELELPTTSQHELDNLIVQLQTDSRVNLVLKNYLGEFAGVTTDVSHLAVCDPSTVNDAAFKLVKAPEAWDLLATLPERVFSSVSVGVVDTGILRSHPEFLDLMNQPNVTVVPAVATLYSENDTGGHGTASAGIIGANNLSQSFSLDCAGSHASQMNGLLAGAAQVKYTLVAVGSKETLTVSFDVFRKSFYDVLTLTDLLGSLKIPVVNLSFDLRREHIGSCKTCIINFGRLTTQFQTTFNKYPNTLFVVSSGNFGGDVGNYTPANLGTLANVLTVAGTSLQDDRLDTVLPNGDHIESSTGSSATIYAPGIVWTSGASQTGPTWATFYGTSASAPMVTGAAGILKALNSNLTPAQIKQTLTTSADDISPVDKPIGSCTLNADNATYTCKRLNVLRAVQQVLGVTTCPPNGIILSLAIDPSNSITIYAGASIWGMFKSTDGAQSWTAIDNGYPLTGIAAGSAQALAIDPSNTHTVYAGTFNRGVFKTIDGGQNWLPANTGLTNLDVRALVIDPTNSSTIYAGTTGGVFKSTNSGQDWASASGGLSSVFVTALGIDPTNTSTLYAGTFGGGVFKSTDGGQSWNQVNTGLSNLLVQALVVNPKTSGTLYAGTNGGGAFKSTDGGQSWAASSVGLTDSAILSLAIDPNNSATLYAGTQSSGVFRSTNAGSNWVAVNAGKASYPEILALIVDPASSTTAYAGTLAGGVFRTTDGAQNWTAASCGIAAPPAGGHVQASLQSTRR